MNAMRIERVRRAFAVGALAAAAGGCNFVDATTANPNAVPNAAVDQLFTSIQVNSYLLSEGQISRIAAMWMQQMAGTDRQFSSLDLYDLNEDDADDEFNTIYTGGGLIDLRLAQDMAREAEREIYLGILQIHEAYLIGMAASIWGDIPYAEAVNAEIAEPVLDPQAQIYADIQALLDDAIANLGGGGAGPGGNDFNFGGDPARWTRVANTLKARFYMHWVETSGAEAQTACGGDCLQKALAASQAGIMTAAGNWNAQHSAASTENNLWYQFLRDRSGYISAGHFLLNLLQTRNDPRLELYFSTGSGPNAGVYVGSPPGAPGGDPGTTASSLAEDGFGDPAWDQPMVTCAENAFIMAEAAHRLSNTSGAQSALQEGVACQEAAYGIDIPNVPTLTGAALLTEILTQKYAALFLNIEAYNDYKRTCQPALISNSQVDVADMPGRLFYGQQERQTNTNMPEPDQQPVRNANDPQGC